MKNKLNKKISDNYIILLFGGQFHLVIFFTNKLQLQLQFWLIIWLKLVKKNSNDKNRNYMFIEF